MIDNYDLYNIDEKPYNTEKIRVNQQMLSIKYIDELIVDNLLDLSPSFQRNNVWTENKLKSRLIESLMLRIPIPAFYFYERQDGVFQVIDGKQRLTTIHSFIHGGFKLSNLEYLNEDNNVNNQFFDNLPEKYKQRIYRTQIAVNVLDYSSPQQVIFDIFRRVNTFGKKLTPQEMRNALCSVNVKKLIQKCEKDNNYVLATEKKINNKRLDADEYVLLFFALRSVMLNKDIISINCRLDDLLDDYVLEISKDFFSIDEYYNIFKESMRICNDIFGDKCFKKIYIDENNNIEISGKNKINRLLFASFSVLISFLTPRAYQLKEKQEVLWRLANKLSSSEFSNAISKGTNDKNNVIIAFKYASEVLKCLE